MDAALFDRLEVRLANALRADAKRLDRTEAVTRVLLCLEPGTGITMTEAARRLGRDPSTATRFVDRAVLEGLARRQAGQQDRRRRLVGLTPEGEVARDALLGRRRARAAAVAAEILTETGLGPGQVEWFLEALASALDQHRDPEQP